MSDRFQLWPVQPYHSFPIYKAQGLLREGGAGDAGVAGGQSGALCSTVLWVPPLLLVLEGLQLHQLSNLFHAPLV